MMRALFIVVAVAAIVIAEARTDWTFDAWSFAIGVAAMFVGSIR